MALKALLLKKQIDSKRKAMQALCAKSTEFEARERELEIAIDEVETEEQRAAVEEMVNNFDQEQSEHNQAVEALEREISDLEADLSNEEHAQNTEPFATTNPKAEHRKDERSMNTARKFFGMSEQQRDIFFAREDVRNYLAEVRAAIKEKRAITNVGLTIPQVMLGLLRENIENYSKLYKHVTVRPVGGEARMVIMGTVPEAIWTDCCANLNELDMAFNDFETDCFKVGGYFAVCNANLEDSDIELTSELLTALGQAIGLALDKAILYGRNSSTTQKMPLGIVSRLVQTEKPTGYPVTARPWADLSTSNVITIGITASDDGPAALPTGAELIAKIVTASGVMKGKYSRGEKVWVMNETTYTALMAATVSVDSNGRIVSGVADIMPVVGGVIEVLSFVPDNVIIGGFFDLYILTERGGPHFASSEHVRFLQEQTVFKGTARYDGAPAIAEAFVAIGINADKPKATGVTFPSDTANAA